MKKSDLSIDRQKLLVHVLEHPGAFALVPPPAPRFISVKGGRGEVTRAHEALGALQALAMRLPNLKLITRTFDRREAVRSSQIEGTNSGVNDLFMYEATGSDHGLPPDVKETLNYVKALEHGLAHVASGGISALTLELIKELHSILMDGVDSFKGPVGEFREKQNWIGGFKIYQARFVPPPADKIPECMADLEALLQYAPLEEDYFEVPIVIRMAIVHAQFETIHPFIDGNGRVGRILLPLMLAAEGYPPVYLAGFLKQNQRTYYDVLANIQLQGEWSEWICFLASGVDEAVHESIKTAQELNAILEQWKREIGKLKLRADSAVYRLPELLIGNPVQTARQVKDSLGISFPAASAALALLEEIGIIIQPIKQQRNRTFVAKAVIDLLDRAT